jgi:hypothetical protein
MRVRNIAAALTCSVWSKPWALVRPSVCHSDTFHSTIPDYVLIKRWSEKPASSKAASSITASRKERLRFGLVR